MIEKKYVFEIEYKEDGKIKGENIYGITKEQIKDVLKKYEGKRIIRYKWEFLGY